MDDLDTLLGRLRNIPLPAALADIDTAVFAALEARRISPLRGRTIALAAALALAIGIAGSLIPSSDPVRTLPSPFGASPMLAPSTLLGSEP
ncbi:hypothetical protein [Tardiphaga sp.]|uniref:hypothetical protein n=1 Tax=Tardiphaga sp. TaxID=1926292 RepID=UPI00352B487D